MLGLIAKGAIGKYKGLKPEDKQKADIALLLGTATSLFLGYKLVNKIGNIFTVGKSEAERKEEEKKVKQALTKELSFSEKPTLSAVEAKTIAQNLYTAFLSGQGTISKNWYDTGTDEDSVFRNLNLLKNRSDYLLISREFGIPRERTLSAELYYELTRSELNKVRSILLKINVKI